MTLRRHWPLIASLLLSASGCADTQQEASAVQQDPALFIKRLPKTASEETFTAFESGQVRPLALSPDGRLLFSVNTPDNRLEIFRVDGHNLHNVGSVMVGLEPVSVSARSNGEVWVVNHLSDSISIVDVSNPQKARVTRTLLVGDEPRDIVFAKDRAYVTTAHRGQNTGRDPQLTTPGVGRADVWVFDPAALGTTLTGTPVTVITLFTDTPRALAVSADGNTVYAAGFNTGNRTTALHERVVTSSGGLPAPLASGAGVAAPWASLIVKYRVGTPDGLPHWLDELNRVWDSKVNFSLPDKDVFAIDASLPVPAQKSDATGAVAGVGTVLFNMAVNPVSGKVYVSNLESRNEVRFEGHNDSGGTGSVRGHIAESRISVISGSNVQARHLNKHIDFTQEGTPAEAAKSLAFPTGMQVSADGKMLYVAALGSNKLGVYKTAEIEADTFVPSTQNQIELTGGGPTGLVLDKSQRYAFVMTRFDNGISVVDLKHKRQVKHVNIYNPEPASITTGRKFLYDATLTSAHGDSACASCHIFGDMDGLAWDLGDPDGTVINNPGPFTLILPGLDPSLHPMKGPMTTQSLRGMANHGPMHWRGDRTGGNDEPTAQPNGGTYNEDNAFKKFNVAFPGLLGRAAELSAEDMQAFTDFMLQVSYPPNPVRNLDNSLTPAQAAGRAFYFNHTPDGQEIPSDTFHNCNGCHTLNPEGNAEHGVAKPGFFGSDGRYSFENETQFFKVPHLRNMYQKVGMFGLTRTWLLTPDNPVRALAAMLPSPLNDESFKGDQIRGFGYGHAGDIDTMFRFFSANVFVSRPATPQLPGNPGIPPDATGVAIRRQLEQFMFAFDSNLAPIVGQQVTLSATNGAVATPRVELLKARAVAEEADLVVRARVKKRELGFLYLPESNTFASNMPRKAPLSEAELLALLEDSELTFTAVPVGTGERIALDRDSDGVLDGVDFSQGYHWDWDWDFWGHDED